MPKVFPSKVFQLETTSYTLCHLHSVLMMKPHLGFALAQTLTKTSLDTPCFHSTVCPRTITNSTSRRSLKLHPKEKKGLVFAQWQESLLPEDPSVPSLELIYKTFTYKYAQAFLLGTDDTKQLAFITAHNHHCSRRPSSSPSSYALPIPLSSPTRISYMLLRDALAHIYAIPESEDVTFCPTDSSSVTSLLPPAVSRYLGINHITANDVLSSIHDDIGIVQNRAVFLEGILKCCGARIAATAVVESASSAPQGQMSITGVLYVGNRPGAAIGEKLYSNSNAIQVEPDFALCLATIVECECFIEANVFNSGCVQIEDMGDVYRSCGHRVVQPIVNYSTSEDTYSYQGKSNVRGETAWILSSPIWQWTASDVMALSGDELRQALRDRDVGVRQGESVESLLRKAAELMDEVQRRELGIILAAKAGMYSLAAELQRGRSKRGKLVVELREVEEQGRWSEVARIASEIKRLEAQTNDITLEPGSYNPDLDQDDWYRPCR